MAKRVGKFGSTGFEQWGGYMEAKKQKLNKQFQEKAPQELNYGKKSSKIFENVSIFVNGYTKPSADELKRLMMLHGGTYHHYYSRKRTTHIIATNLPYSKIVQLKNEKVVKPEWIMDSITIGELLPENQYFLYNRKYGQKTLKFDNKNDKIDTSECIISSEQDRLNNEFSDKIISESSKTKEKSDSSPNKECSTLYNETFSDNKSKLPQEDEKELLTDIEVALASDVINEQNKEVIQVVDDKDSVPSVHKNPKNSVRAGEPNFLTEFYNHSRLHYLSTAKSDFQSYVAQLCENPDKQYSGLDKLKVLFQDKQQMHTKKLDNSSDKIFMHIDMDCFFVSVSLLKYPHLKGTPVAVTHSKTGFRQPPPGSNREYEYNYYKNRHNKNKQSHQTIDNKIEDNDDFENGFDEYGSASEIASCSYEARKYGICNGCFLGEAKKLCPDLQTIPYDFEGYEKVSKLLYDIVASYTLNIQAVSCDEMFVDCTSVISETGISPLEFAAILRKEIEEKTGCTASAGLGNNLLLARLATKAAKPNGQYLVDSTMMKEFMENQDIRDLPGVGYVMKNRLEQMNVKTCKDLQIIPIGKLQTIFGSKTGKMLYEYCRGIDHREIKASLERKSVSAEINYGMRFQQLYEAISFLKELAEEVQRRLQKISMRGKSVTLKLKIRKKDAPMEPSKFMGHGVCDNITKTIQLASATNNSVAIGRACTILLRNLNINPGDIRGMGIQVGRLEAQSGKKNENNQSLLNFMQKTSLKENTTRNQMSTLNSNCAVVDSTNSDMNVSLSEVDPEVFASLPKDLQNEIINYHRNKQNVPENNSSKIKSYEIPTTSTSHLNASDNDSKNRNDQNFILPRLSQLDRSVFNALPNELKEEIMEAYKEKTINQLQHSPCKLPCAPVNSKSPRKHSSSTKSKNSPSSKQKNTKVCLKQTTGKLNNNDTGNLQKKFPTEIGNISYSNIKSEKLTTVQPSLCGAIFLNEVKELLSEWVSSSSVPEEEDITVFTKYVVEVVEEKNLEKLDRIIKFLYRLVKKKNNLYWQKFYLDLVNTIQSMIVQFYGSVLKIEVDF